MVVLPSDRESGQQRLTVGKAERKAQLQKNRIRQTQDEQALAQVNVTIYTCVHVYMYYLLICTSASSGTRESYGGSVTVSGSTGSGGRTGQRQTAGRGRGQTAGKRVRSGAGVG